MLTVEEMALERLRSRCTRDEVTGCLIAPVGGKRYPAVRVGDKKVDGHRLSYLLSVGEIPDGLCVCHRCNNKRCIEPSHFYLGTRAQNVKDAWHDGLFVERVRGTDVAVSKLTEEQVREIRHLWSEGWSKRKLAKKFGVCPATAYSVAKRQVWAWVE